MNMICGLCYEVVLCCSACIAGGTQELDMEFHVPEGWEFLLAGMCIHEKI